MVLVSIKGFLAVRIGQWAANHAGRMVSKGALEQWNLLEATTAGLRGCSTMRHHVLGKSSLHAGQHFDEVLLRQRQVYMSFKSKSADNVRMQPQRLLMLLLAL